MWWILDLKGVGRGAFSQQLKSIKLPYCSPWSGDRCSTTALPLPRSGENQRWLDLCKWAALQRLCRGTVQITFIFIDFRVLRLRLKRKTHPAFRIWNAFYFQTDINLRFKRKRDVRLTCKRVWCILHHTLSLKWLGPLQRILSLKWIWPAFSETLVLNETKPTQRSQITDQNLRKEANAKCAVSVHAKRVLNS